MRVLQGDTLSVLRQLPDESVHCMITSPPYWALRSYLPADHPDKCVELGSEKLHDCLGWASGSCCGECYICRMTEVFSEARRVLRRDGTLFLNIGDSYTSGGRSTFRSSASDNKGHQVQLKPKDLCAIPERLALSLQASGWYWRSKIIWRKPAPMPGSQQDRPTVDFEPVWLFSKSKTYFWDGEAVKEPFCDGRNGNPGGGGFYAKEVKQQRRRVQKGLSKGAWNEDGAASGRTLRTVWDLPPMPTSDRICKACRRYFENSRNLKQVDRKLICPCGASDWISHYAGFPLELPERCILAGTSEKGACSACGVPWVRVVEREGCDMASRYARGEPQRHGLNGASKSGASNVGAYSGSTTTTGWRPSCTCHADIKPCVVLDPFSGAATTGLACLKLGRNYIGIELSADYIELGQRRAERLYPLLMSQSSTGRGVTSPGLRAIPR